MELFITILLTSIVLGSLGWALARGQTFSYRPSRQEIVELLQKVIDGDAQQYSWDLFIGYPNHSDPELEEIRRRCGVLSEGDADNPAYPSGIGCYLFNRAGREQIEKILADLKQLIADEPYQKDF